MPELKCFCRLLAGWQVKDRYTFASIAFVNANVLENGFPL